MSTEYEKATVKLMEYLEQTVTFAKGELPDVALQIVQYGATSAFIWFLFSAIIAGLLLLIFIREWLFNRYGDGFSTLFSFLGFLLFSTVAISQKMEMLKIETAPKLYVMEYMRDMVRTK